MMKSFTIASIASAAFAYNLGQHEAQAALELAQSSNHTCLTGINRLKAPVDDFWKILGGTAQFKDDDFTADKSALYWSDIESNAQMNYDN